MVHHDLDTLLNDLLPFAKRMLAEEGEFYPFAASMSIDGEITSRGASTGSEHPKSQELIDILTAALQRLASEGSIRAAGICFDVRIIPPGQVDKTDAVQLGLEREGGDAADVFVPYAKLANGEFAYGQMFASRRNPTFFVQQQGEA